MAGYKSLFAFWSGGAGSVTPTTAAGKRSMLAPWIGGAAALPASSTAGYRSMLAFWSGGAFGYEAPAVTSTLTPAGVRFIPIRVGEARVEPAYVSLKLGRAAAIGEVYEYHEVVEKVAVPEVAAPKVVVGTVIARSAGVSTQVGRAYGDGAIFISGSVVAPSLHVGTKVGRAFGEGEIIIPGNAGVEAVFVSWAAPAVTGTGIVNPSEEELILMYQVARRSKRLQERQNYGKFARI